MLVAATPLFNVMVSAPAPVTVYEFALSNSMPPTVFGPLTATFVGVVGIGPNFATAPGLSGMPELQLSAVDHSPSAPLPFHSVIVVSATLRTIRVFVVSLVIV